MSDSLPTSDVISVERNGYITTVWLDRPDKRNAMGPPTWEDLPRIMDALSDDPETRVVVIAAKGKAFSVGIDLVAFGPAFMAGGVDPDSPATS
jgi:enoyl-CoA hydratase